MVLLSLMSWWIYSSDPQKEKPNIYVTVFLYQTLPGISASLTLKSESEFCANYNLDGIMFSLNNVMLSTIIESSTIAT